jgi:hypothetical protein
VNAPAPAPAQPKLPGVIETLNAGYQTLNRHLYLLLLPVALDLFYWLGPRLSVQPVAAKVSDALQRLASSPEVGVTTPQAMQSVEMLKDMITAMGASMNLFSLLSGAVSIPSLVASQDLPVPAWLAGVAARSISSAGEMMTLSALLFVLGVAIGAVYLGLAAHVVRDGRVQPDALAQRIPPYALRYLGLLLLLLVCVLVIGIPASLFIGLVALLSPLLGSVLMVAVWAAFLWIYLSLFFTIDAIFVSEVGPKQAIINSITVVRRSSSSAMRLFLVILVITWGMAYVWSALGTSDVATLVGIAGNAYIGAGLTVASMIYYRDRMVTPKK